MRKFIESIITNWTVRGIAVVGMFIQPTFVLFLMLIIFVELLVSFFKTIFLGESNGNEPS